MVAPCQWFTNQPILALKFLSVYVHRSTLPQSRIRSTAPSEREPGNVPHNVNHPPAGCFVSGRVIFGFVWGDVLPFIRVLAKPWGCGRFSSPETQKFFTFHHSTGDTPSVSHSLDSSLREGAGKCSHSTGYSLMSGVTGDFHRPYETLNVLHSTIHRGVILPGLWLWQVCCGVGG